MRRLMGIDYGKRKIGIAIALEGWPEPIAVIHNNNRLSARLDTLAKQYQVEEIVIGLPEGSLVPEIIKFGKDLSEKIQRKVVYSSENLTSREAIDKMIQAGKKRNYRAKQEDAFAAALILESYLEKNNV